MKRLSVLFLAVLLPVISFAQSNLANDFLSDLDDSLSGVSTSLYDIASAVIGLCALVSVGIAFWHQSKGDQQAKDKFLTVAGSLLIAAVLLYVISNVFLK